MIHYKNCTFDEHTFEIDTIKVTIKTSKLILATYENFILSKSHFNMITTDNDLYNCIYDTINNLLLLECTELYAINDFMINCISTINQQLIDLSTALNKHREFILYSSKRIIVKIDSKSSICNVIISI